MMYAHLKIGPSRYKADLTKPIDLSLPLVPNATGPNCFYAPVFRTDPVKAGDFIGDTQQGGAVNFKNVFLNPHGNGTHTECVGHIAREPYLISDCLQRFHFAARLVSIYPQRMDNGDRVITRQQLEETVIPGETEALILRTEPNAADKRIRNWSGSNPPYLAGDAAQFLADAGVVHLLLDLPSVDREEDGGALAAHKAFWRYPEAVRTEATITEMVFVPDNIQDGLYFLNIQIVSFVLDVSPSKPVLYPLELCL